MVGAAIGIASGVTVILHRQADGVVTFRSGWLSGIFWVLGMGSRFAFIYWSTHGGVGTIASFSANHQITGDRSLDGGAARHGGVRSLRPHADDGAALEGQGSLDRSRRWPRP